MRTGSILPSASNYYNSEVGINELRNSLESINMLGAASNRVVALDAITPVQITPGSNKKVMHIANNLTIDIRYGGSGVTTSTGGVIYAGATFALACNTSTSIYLILKSGSGNVDIVEFA